MNKNDLSVATITWARDDHEEKLLRRSLQQLAAPGIPVYISDGGSSPSFLDFLRSIPHFILPDAPAKGVWAQARNSVMAAYRSGSPYILYTEPDKATFFEQVLPRMLSDVMVDKRSGIILASRSPVAFATFPTFQQMTETAINNCCTEITHQPADHTYGPFLMNRQLAPYLQLVKEDIGWGWRPYMFAIASRLGLDVKSFFSDAPCPPDQREDDEKERIYRMRQLSQNIQGLVLAMGVDISSRISHS